MSAFAPLNVMGGQNQKKQLLQSLLNQYQQSASRAAGLTATAGGPAVAAAALPSSRPFGGAGHLTQAVPNFAKELLARLGPGGFGHPIIGRENSPAPGVDVARGLIANPHAGSVLAPGGTGATMPIPTAAAAPAPAAATSAPTATVSSPASAAALGGPAAIQGPTGSVVDPGFLMQSSGRIDLGNGLFYDPATQSVVGGAAFGGVRTGTKAI